MYAESVSVKTAVRMFGGEAKIRKLPTPDRSLSRTKTPGKTENPSTSECLETTFDEDVDIDISSHANNIMNYPICGTISPLTDSKGQSKASGSRSNDSISFVFGRPSSPVSERGLDRCRSPPEAVRRALSPVTDITPIRRRSVNGKPPIGGPPSRRRNRNHGPASDSGIITGMQTSGPFMMDVMRHNGIYCEQCNVCLTDFKRQALRLLYPDGPRGGAMVKVRFTSCHVIDPDRFRDAVE